MKSKPKNKFSLSQSVTYAVLLSAALTGHAATTDPGPIDSCLAGAKPLLSVADFSGDGIVDNTDLMLLGNVIDKGKYIAFFDRNVDGKVNLKDVNAASQDLGSASTDLDREITEVYWATTKYHALGTAALDGYVPFTPVAVGHGRHWLQPFTFASSAYPNEPQRAKPEGLNYNKDGQIQAVYWGQSALTDSSGHIISEPPADFFTPGSANEPINWHHHENACITNLGFIDKVHYQEGVSPVQCIQRQGLADGISTSFYMMHLWLYYLNPNGAFSMTHPCAGMDK